MKTWKLGLLPKIVIAIGLGIVCGLFFPDWLVRIFITINGLFGNFLGFIIPLLILGLVAPGIADLVKVPGVCCSLRLPWHMVLLFRAFLLI